MNLEDNQKCPKCSNCTHKPNYLNFCVFLVLAFFLVLFSPIFVIVCFCLLIKFYHEINTIINDTETFIHDIDENEIHND